MDFFAFASNSPWLTFFLFLIVGNTLVGIARAITGNHPKKDEEDD